VLQPARGQAPPGPPPHWPSPESQPGNLGGPAFSETTVPATGISPFEGTKMPNMRLALVRDRVTMVLDLIHQHLAKAQGSDAMRDHVLLFAASAVAGVRAQVEEMLQKPERITLKLGRVELVVRMLAAGAAQLENDPQLGIHVLMKAREVVARLRAGIDAASMGAGPPLGPIADHVRHTLDDALHRIDSAGRDPQQRQQLFADVQHRLTHAADRLDALRRDPRPAIEHLQHARQRLLALQQQIQQLGNSPEQARRVLGIADEVTLRLRRGIEVVLSPQLGPEFAPLATPPAPPPGAVPGAAPGAAPAARPDLEQRVNEMQRQLQQLQRQLQQTRQPQAAPGPRR
jgi:hypothetical protein